jgi:hypothetical protein
MKIVNHVQYINIIVFHAISDIGLKIVNVLPNILCNINFILIMIMISLFKLPKLISL